jgi:NitT/TauT family transport system ATP-binding protein
MKRSFLHDGQQTIKEKHPLIQVDSVSAIFPNGNGGLHVLEQVSFSVFPQEFVCILGPSGSGKTTLLRLLSGLLLPTSGKIYIEGELVSGPQHGMGFVFQKANLMPWRTVLHNIQLPLEIEGLSQPDAAAKAMEMVELVGLHGFENALPRDLSGGMAQRVAIARALAHDPDVLLLDEPLGSLDALTRERMGLELVRIWQARRKTVVMVTHSISEALFLADRVLVISRIPGQLCLDLHVDFDRPRREDIRYTAVFGKMAQMVRQAIGEANEDYREGY